jgi:hypothetical protein
MTNIKPLKVKMTSFSNEGNLHELQLRVDNLEAQARIAELKAALACVLPYVNTSTEDAQYSANERQDTPASDAIANARAALKAKP